MSKYGLKIKNFQAGSIYGVDLGIRDNYDSKDAMLTNSLFLDFMMQNGLTTIHNDSTRDIICIGFRYGTRSFQEELKNIRKSGKEFREERHKAYSSGDAQRIEAAEQYMNRLNYMYQRTLMNQDKFEKKSADEIRIQYYENGVKIKYPKFKHHKLSGFDVVEYRMLYRTPGKAKHGSCMFIKKSLYKKAHEFLWMGLKLPKKNAPIVEIGAYSSLVTSTIEDRIHIEPEQILVVKDIDSIFETKAISVECDENKHCVAKHLDNYPMVNTMFDGQALIDSSIFPTWGNGFILLRQHFCKMAAFNTNIQTFFKDWFGDSYEDAQVPDMWGNMHYVKDVKLITTDNALKWLKFKGVTFDYWADKVRANGSLFGIVKTAHPSKLGSVQRMSYQMINALDENTIDEVMRVSKDYIYSLKSDDATFLDYLYKNRNFANDFEVLYELCQYIPQFVSCDYFKQRKNHIISDYIKNMKTGRIIQNADNLVIVGSPYAMLLTSVGADVEDDTEFSHEDGCVQCWTERFDDGDYLAAFRNPYNSRNNMDYMHNVHHEVFSKYFNLGKQCIAVNMLHTDFQNRNNGSDQDSDTIYTTNQAEIVEHARRCYVDYPTIVNQISMDKNIYDSSLRSFAIVDNNVSASQTDIGESSNIAQLAQTYSYNYEDDKYTDAACILSVLAQVAIDSAKRRFDVDVSGEIRRIKQDLDVKGKGYPEFWMGIRKDFNQQLIDRTLQCPMNTLYRYRAPKVASTNTTIPMSDFFIPHKYEFDRKLPKKIEDFIERYSIDLFTYNISEDSDDYLLLRSDYEEMIQYLRQVSISSRQVALMSWLLNRAFMITPQIRSNYKLINSKLNKNKALLMKTLYDVNKTALFQCFTTPPSSGDASQTLISRTY